MQRSQRQLTVRVDPWIKRQIEAEALARGVDPAALIRALLRQHLADVAQQINGWANEYAAVMVITRADIVHIEIPRRQVHKRLPDDPAQIVADIGPTSNK